ncbi:MAG: hypothetical protein R6X33_08470 [Candidatus Brocadiia bacterium]
MQRSMALGLVAALVCATLLLTGSPNSGAAAEPNLPGAVRLTELIPVSRETVQINGKDKTDILLPGDGEAQRVEVSMRRTRYECQALRVRNGETSAWSHDLVCYELVTDSPFVWAAWTYPSAAFWHVRTLAGPDDTPYLAYVKWSTAVLSPITESRDRALALQEFLLDEPQEDLLIPVSKLIPESEYWGVYATHTPMEVLSITERGEDLAVSIADPEGNEHVFLGRGREWRVSE